MMIKTKILLLTELLILQFLFFSCDFQNSDDRNFEIISIKKIEINSGFNTSFFDIQVENNKEYIVLYDKRTYKKISFADVETQKIEIEIPLDSVIFYCGGIKAIDIVNSDSIFILSEYTNLIFLINGNGKIIKKIDLNPYLMQKAKFETAGGWDFFVDDSKSVFLKCYYSTANDTTGNFYQNDPIHYQVDAKKAPYLFKVENVFSDTLQTMFGVEGFYNQFAETDQIVVEGGYFFCNNKSIFIATHFVDTIYEYDQSSLKLIHKHLIKSEYTTIGYTPSTIEDFYRDDYYHNDIAQTNGYIRRVLFDKYRNFYYFLTYHKIPLETPRGERVRPWSIMIYDEGFNKLDEILMDEKKYSPRILVTKKGLLISNYPEKKDDKDIFTKTTFELFELIEN